MGNRGTRHTLILSHIVVPVYKIPCVPIFRPAMPVNLYKSFDNMDTPFVYVHNDDYKVTL